LVRGLAAGQWDGELGERAAAPAHGQHRPALPAHGVDDHLLDQGVQELLAVAVADGGRRPDAAEVAAEREQPAALLVCESARTLVLAQGELGLGGGQGGERLLRLEAAGDEAVLELDLAVAALRALRLVSGPLDLQPPLSRAASWSCSSASAARNAAWTPAGVSAASSASATASSICTPLTLRHHCPRPSTSVLPGQW
jgi:hypothetical protein